MNLNPPLSNPFSIAKDVFLYAWQYRRAALTILALPFLILISTHLLRFIPKIGEGVSFLMAFSNILMLSFMSVTGYRLMLGDEKIRLSPPLFQFGLREMKYALVQIIFNACLSFLMMPGIGLILKALGVESGPFQLQTLAHVQIIPGEALHLLAGILYILIIHITSLRFSFIFPNIALGRPIKITESWNQMDGIFFRFMASSVIVMIPLLLLSGGMGFILLIANHKIFHKGIGLPTLITLLSLFQYLVTFFMIAVTSLYYRLKNTTA